MEKEFVTYEQALALKELGFDEMCFGFYSNQKFELMLCRNREPWMGNGVVSAPLKQQLFRWFRRRYSSQCDIWQYEDDLTFAFSIKIKFNRIDGYIDFTSYEEAENACIDELIEISKQINKQ